MGTAPKKAEVPEQPTLEKAISPIATVSSNVDPSPSYIMSAACAGGAGYSYLKLSNPRAAIVAGCFSAAYLFAGRLQAQGHPRLGYDVGVATSLALLGVSGPPAWVASDTYAAAMATLGGMSSVANLIKAYQIRTGHPLELSISERKQDEPVMHSR